MRPVLAAAALLAALSLVAWRQTRAFEAVGALERVQRERILAESQRSDLQRHIEYLESRARVVPEARERLGMRTPETGEIVILWGEAR